MAKLSTISKSNFERMSSLAMEKTPLRRECSLKEIEVLDDTNLSLSGVPIRMTKEAFSGICKAVGLPIGFDRTFTGAFGEKARQQLVNRLKVAAQAKGNTSVSLVVNPKEKRIISVQKNPEDLISNRTFIETSSRIIDKYNLEVNSFSVNDNGEVVISAASPKNVWGIQGLKDEEFFGGVTFSNTPQNGFNVSPFLYRLICANGMIGRDFEDNFHLGQMHPHQMEEFWNHLNQLADRGFRPSSFEDKVRLAINTRASLAEMEEMHQNLMSLSDADHKELEAWIPFQETKAKFLLHGADTNLFSKKQKSGARTGMNVWDLVNGATHFASHDNGFKVEDYDRRRIQMAAGKLLSKQNFDMMNFVSSPF